MKKKTKMVTSPDDWFPSYDNCQVKVSCLKYGTNHYGVVVGGADDCLCSIELPDMTQAIALYDRIENGITKAELIALGFKFW